MPNSSPGNPQNTPDINVGLSSAPDDLQTRLNLVALEKSELEKKEITLRINDLLNWKRKRAQLAISLLVPIATAAIALLAAYVELRSVRSERDQLATEKQAFEREKASDYTAIKINHAIDFLREKESSPPPTRGAVLDALQNILLGGAQLPESSVETIFHYIMDPDQRVAGTAQAILNTSKSPTYARLIASTLITPTPPIQYKLAQLITETQFDSKNIAYIAPLVNSNDSAVAGSAMRALGKHSSAPLNTLIHLDGGSSEYERMTFLVTSIITENNQAQKLSLKFMADRLLSDRAFGADSDEFYSACIVNQDSQIYSENILGRTDVNVANKLLLGITLPHSKQLPFSVLAHQIFVDPKKTVELLHSLRTSDLDFIASSLAVAKPKFIIDDFSKYSSEELSNLQTYLDFDNTPHTRLIELRDTLKSHKSFASVRLIDAILKQDDYDLKAAQADGIDTISYISRLASSNDQKLIDIAFEMFKEALGKKEGRAQSFSISEVNIAIKLVESGKPKSLLDTVYTDAPFEFLGALANLAKLDKAYVVGLLRTSLKKHDLTPLQGLMLAVKAEIDSDFSALAQEAFDEALHDVSSIEQSALRESPDFEEGTIDRALMVLSLLTESPSFAQDVAKLKATMGALGLIPARGLGISIFVLNGSFFNMIKKDGYARLIRALSPDLPHKLDVVGCDGHVHNKIMQTDQVKELIWSEIMN